VVKARYISTAGSGAKAARTHLAYLERDGVEQDGSQGRLFDRDGDIDRETFGADIPEEKRQFRFIVAPEDGNELDLRAYTKQLMDRMEKDLARPLRWAAVCHYNTDNPHVHIVVRGVDKRGAELRIDRGYISEGLRLRGQEIATRELGPRTVLETRRQRSRDIVAERLTLIDRRLAEHLSNQQTIDARAIADAPNLPRPEALARLATLERLQLAERASATSWRLADGWQETLRQLGERGDIIKRIHRALEGRPIPFQVFEPRDGVRIEGVVRRKGLHDEQSGQPYAVIETACGEAVYVRLDQVTASEVKEGAVARISCTRQPWLKATDEILQREAHANFGIYSPTVHLRKLEARPLVIGGHPVKPEEVIAVNLRRLERLARYRLVAKRPDGTWFVPTNLTNTLREREQTHPRFRLVVEPMPPELGQRVEPLSETGQKAERRPPELGRKAEPPSREMSRSPEPAQHRQVLDADRLRRAQTGDRHRGPSLKR
jgi:type IV secretory pathway VirD2 relaxase